MKVIREAFINQGTSVVAGSPGQQSWGVPNQCFSLVAFRLVILPAFSGFFNLISFDEAVSQFLGPAVYRGFVGGCDSWSIVFVHGQVSLGDLLRAAVFVFILVRLSAAELTCFVGCCTSRLSLLLIWFMLISRVWSNALNSLMLTSLIF